MEKQYLCIDLKTFFASVECVERGLDPFSTNLVVTDPSRGKGAICLAITPKMKEQGIKNRCRVFEIPSNIKYIVAIPRMKKYIEYSANVYEIYLKYVAKEDMHVYSIDEVFLDVTSYLKYYGMSASELAKKIMKDIFDTYGLTATAGVGTNMYLAKIALDITAKHNKSNIGYLNEKKYKEELWHHKPLKDFWQIGNGIEKRLNKMQIFDMYDIAHTETKKLYKEFGVNAKYLIEHSWGKETCTISDIKEYKPKNSSISTSQILFKDYNYENARLVLKEMVEILSQRLVKDDLLTDCIKMYIGYSKDIMKSTGGSKKLPYFTNLYSKLSFEFDKLFTMTTYKNVPIRKIEISFERLKNENAEQINLFDNIELNDKEKRLEKSIIEIKAALGKNAILRGMNLQEEATTIIRNKLIGGHNGE